MTNFILIMSDEHNPRYINKRGNQFISTPNLDELSSRGGSYSNAYCNSPLCLPSRTAFLSGRHVHRSKAYNNCLISTKSGIRTFIDDLATNDVHTVHIGKFDYISDIKTIPFSQTACVVQRSFPGDKIVSRQPLAVRKGISKLRSKSYGPRNWVGEKDRKKIDCAIQWLKYSSPKIRRPWIIFINLNLPHYPHLSTENFWNLYKDIKFNNNTYKSSGSYQHPVSRDLREHFECELMSEEDKLGLKRGYFARISLLDDLIGSLFDYIYSTNLHHTTNIVYTSDHGEMLGKFNMWWKSCLFDDAAKIPMIVAGPSFDKSFQSKEMPVDLHDLRSTILNTFNICTKDKYQGSDIRENIDNKYVFSEYHGPGARNSSYMIRRNNWKLIFHPSEECQLFDVKKDPEETVNLIETNICERESLLKLLYSVCDPVLENKIAEKHIKKQLGILRGVIPP